MVTNAPPEQTEGMEVDLASLTLTSAGDEADEAYENPLLLEDIIENVLGYLDFDNLKQCRLVHPLWNLVVCKLLSPNCQSIHFLGPYQRLSGNGNGKGIADMSKLVTLLQTSWNFPCKRFGVDCDINTTPEEEQIVTSFFHLIAPWTTELEISDSALENEQLFRGPKPQEIHFPCLTSLIVKINTAEMILGNIQNNLEFLASILDHAPNLQRLYLHAHNDPQVLTAALTLLDHVNCSKIREFSLHGDMGDEHLNKIVELGMTKLEKLHLQITEYAGVNSESFQYFLQRQSESLVTLHLESLDFKRRIVVELPRLPKLKKVTVENFYTSETMEIVPTPLVSFSGICYQSQLPVLKSITFLGSTYNKTINEFLGPGIRPVDTVEELELPEGLSKTQVIRNAARVFPKLRKLKVPYLLMGSVYVAFDSVEELTLVYDGHINPAQSVDSILTRYSERECHQARNSLEAMAELINTITDPVPFLKRLKVLKILQRGDSRTSDLSCRAIFLKMDALKCLKLVGRFPHISEPVIREMKEKFRVEFEEDDWYRTELRN